MRFRREARRERYDAIVVGSGLGGLACAALLARAGKPVLVVERHDRPGGYAHAFRRGGYLFDSAVHLVGGCEPTRVRGRRAACTGCCGAVGARDELEFERDRPDLHRGVSRARAAPAARARRVRALARRGVPRASARASTTCVAGVPRDPERGAPRGGAGARRSRSCSSRAASRRSCATAARRWRASWTSTSTTPRAKAVLATFWPYLGLPPARVSFLYFATMLLSYVAEGAFYCKGSFQRFARALARRGRARGRRGAAARPVRRIARRGGPRVRAWCSRTASASRRRVVVSNADLRQTVDGAVRRASTSRARCRRALGAARAVDLRVRRVPRDDLDLRALGATHETFVYEGFDHDAALRGARSRAGPAGGRATVPTLADPSLAPPGEHLMALTTLVPYAAAQHWRAREGGAASTPCSRRPRARFPGLRESRPLRRGRHAAHAGALYTRTATARSTAARSRPTRSAPAGPRTRRPCRASGSPATGRSPAAACTAS